MRESKSKATKGVPDCVRVGWNHGVTDVVSKTTKSVTRKCRRCGLSWTIDLLPSPLADMMRSLDE